MNKGAIILGFVCGLGVGIAAGMKLAKDKYLKMADEEIESVKEIFRKKEDKPEEPAAEEEAKTEKESPVSYLKKYSETVDKYGGKDLAEAAKKAVEKFDSEDKPYMISFEEYGEFEDYETVDLTFYSDKVLADDNDEIVDDDIISSMDVAVYFSQCNEDAIYLRNDARRCDYEILRDIRTYVEVTGEKPHLKWRDDE